MKTNELMIGDWVNFYPSPLAQNGIYYDRVIVLDRYDVECEPIPLTAEILEKNGWKCETHGISTDVRGEIAKDVWFMMQLLDGYDHWNIRLSKCGVEETFELFKQYKYVHELQHTLRLCGLNELADNFKV